MDNVVRRHRTEAPARRVVEGAAREEIHEPRGYDARTTALVVIALLFVLFALRTGAAFFIPLMVSIMLSYALSRR